MRFTPGLRLPLLVGAFISTLARPLQLSAQDQITLNNNSGNPIGLLVDGKLGKSNANDQTYVSAISPAVIGQFSVINGNKPNEIMAFTADRPMAIVSPVAWTTGNDNIGVTFPNKILIPVTVWVVYGDYATVQSKAANDLLTTSTIYGTERVGVDFSTVTFMDATANPLAPNYYDVTTTPQEVDMKNGIGFVSGQINLYYTRSFIVNGQQYTNIAQAIRPSAGGPMVAVGSTFITNGLAHEIGHLFELSHVHSGVATQWFDFSNVMSQNGSPNSRFLTEGQVLRMHLTSGSALNATYHARPGQLIRDCDPTSTTSTDTCPGVQKRIWADGTYPAN